MTRATLWIEMTIAGSVYVATLFFLLAWIYCVGDLRTLATQLEPYKTYVGVAVVAISYIFGFVAHRAIQMVNWRLWKLGVLTGIVGRIDENVIRDGDDQCKQKPKALEKRMAEETAIWALDPQRIHREIDFQFAQVALLRSLIWSTPFLALSILLWRLTTWHHATALVYALVSLWLLVIGRGVPCSTPSFALNTSYWYLSNGYHTAALSYVLVFLGFVFFGGFFFLLFVASLNSTR
jgi:hypothetical protein